MTTKLSEILEVLTWIY